MLLQPLLTISSAYRVHTFERQCYVPLYLCQSYLANEKHNSEVDWSSEVIPSHLSLSLYEFDTATSIERAEKMAITISNFISYHNTLQYQSHAYLPPLASTKEPLPNRYPKGSL